MQFAREDVGGRIVPQLIGARFTGSPFDVWPAKNQPLWIDVSIPREASPGTYTGRFTVTIPAFGETHLPVKLTVWNFILPDGSPIATHFGSLDGIAEGHRVSRISPEFADLQA